MLWRLGLRFLKAWPKASGSRVALGEQIMPIAGRYACVNRKRRPAGIVFLGTSLVFSALLTAVAVRAPAYHGLAWISLLPLFHAMRSLRLNDAGLAGGLWGLCLYLFCVTDSPNLIVHITPSISSLILFAAVPAVYVGLGALLTRAIGFNPLMLAVGWVLVEIAFRPLRLRHGLLAGAQMESIQVQWLARLLGYVFVAFLVAYVNASLLAFVVAVRGLGAPQSKSPAELIVVGRIAPSLSCIFYDRWIHSRARPRAPPAIPSTLCF